MVITNVRGQKHRSARGIVSGDVTDDPGKALDGMCGLDIANRRVMTVTSRHIVY